MDDKLHQPYRSKLFSGGEVIFSRVEALPECLSVAISGSGPSVIALVKGTTQRVAEAMCRTFTEYGVRSQFFVLDGSAQGARVDVSMELAEALAAAAGLSPKENTDVCSCEPGTADKAGGCR